MTFDNTLIRCSKLSDIMTNIKSEDLTKGHLTACRKLYREMKWRRSPVLKTKQVMKGRLQEQDAVTLISRYKKQLLKSNTERLKNTFISGTPDIFLGEEIQKATAGYDAKCSWDPFTFPFQDQYEGTMYGIDPDYYFQNMGYMILTGAEIWSTVYCLVNAPAFQILNEKYSLSLAMGDPSSADEEYIKGCIDIEKNMIYDMDQFVRDNPSYVLHSEVWDFDIPLLERVMAFEVKRDDNIIDKIYERVKLVRKELLRLSGRSISQSDFASDGGSLKQ